MLHKVAKFTYGLHREQRVIFIHIPYSEASITEIKKLPTAKWSQTNKCWYVKDVVAIREQLHLIPKEPVYAAIERISDINQKPLRDFIALLKLKAYSPNTVKTYVSEFCQLLYAIQNIHVDTLTDDSLKKYMLYCIDKLRISENQAHSRINAIKFYFEKVLHQGRIHIELPRPKRHSILPKVLSVQEVHSLIAATENIKHYLILTMCYGMGLRLSEIANLKCSDIDFKRFKVFIERAKGKKDRYVNLPKSIISTVSRYLEVYKPEKFLFEGQYGGRYSRRAIQQVFYACKQKANISKPVGIHSLRHSYATHLMEMGTDVSLIQQLLGHNNIKTTLIYTHISQRELKSISSPLDKLLESTSNLLR